LKRVTIYYGLIKKQNEAIIKKGDIEYCSIQEILDDSNFFSCLVEFKRLEFDDFQKKQKNISF